MIMQALRDSLSAAELVGFSAIGDVAASDTDKAGKAKSGKIQRGQLVLLEAFGGGFTWGSALLRY